jgi:hypothetical protein
MLQKINVRARKLLQPPGDSPQAGLGYKTISNGITEEYVHGLEWKPPRLYTRIAMPSIARSPK